MKWEEHLKHQLPANGRWENDEQLYLPDMSVGIRRRM